jgi:hypothetical protein
VTADLTAQRLTRIEQDQRAMNERLDEILTATDRTAEIIGGLLDLFEKAEKAEEKRRKDALVEAMNIGYKQGYEAAAGVPLVEAKSFGGLHLVAGTEVNR